MGDLKNSSGSEKSLEREETEAVEVSVIGVDGRVAGTSRGEASFACSTCRETFPSMEEVTKHAERCSVTLKRCYICPSCNKYFTTSWAVNRHLKTVHSASVEEIRKLRTMIQKKDMPIIEINKLKKAASSDFPRGGAEDMELAFELNKCCHCGRKFERKAALVSHTHACQRKINARMSFEASKQNNVDSTVNTPKRRPDSPMDDSEEKRSRLEEMDILKVIHSDVRVSTPRLNGSPSTKSEENEQVVNGLREFRDTSPEGTDSVYSVHSDSENKTPEQENGPSNNTDAQDSDLDASYSRVEIESVQEYDDSEEDTLSEYNEAQEPAILGCEIIDGYQSDLMHLVHSDLPNRIDQNDNMTCEKVNKGSDREAVSDTELSDARFLIGQSVDASSSQFKIETLAEADAKSLASNRNGSLSTLRSPLSSPVKEEDNFCATPKQSNSPNSEDVKRNRFSSDEIKINGKLSPSSFQDEEPSSDDESSKESSDDCESTDDELNKQGEDNESQQFEDHCETNDEIVCSQMEEPPKSVSSISSEQSSDSEPVEIMETSASRLSPQIINSSESSDEAEKDDSDVEAKDNHSHLGELIIEGTVNYDDYFIDEGKDDSSFSEDFNENKCGIESNETTDSGDISRLDHSLDFHSAMSLYIDKTHMACLLCGKTFPNVDHGANHVAADHFFITRYRCSVDSCTFKSYTKFEAKRHILLVHKIKKSNIYIKPVDKGEMFEMTDDYPQDFLGFEDYKDNFNPLSVYKPYFEILKQASDFELRNSKED